MIVALSGNLDLIKVAILAGEVVAFPTDTLFALAVDATNTKAIEKLFALKKRPLERTAPVLVASLEEGLKHAEFNEAALKLAHAFWPGALTMVLPVRENSPLSPIAIRGDTVGLRMPECDIALQILNSCSVPLLGTSANLSGGPDLNDASEIHNTFGNGLAYVVEPELKPSGVASTIVKVDNKISILRLGVISEEEIAKLEVK